MKRVGITLKEKKKTLSDPKNVVPTSKNNNSRLSSYLYLNIVKKNYILLDISIL